mmetsp:Transcript_17784/g.38325  ORF Transcript_17784/g.38325 Transcript_17784/m.38325 type:complete len:201 (+) Transcript_17784:228-830(+)
MVLLISSRAALISSECPALISSFSLAAASVSCRELLSCFFCRCTFSFCSSRSASSFCWAARPSACGSRARSRTRSWHACEVKLASFSYALVDRHAQTSGASKTPSALTSKEPREAMSVDSVQSEKMSASHSLVIPWPQSKARKAERAVRRSALPHLGVLRFLASSCWRRQKSTLASPGSTSAQCVRTSAWQEVRTSGRRR